MQQAPAGHVGWSIEVWQAHDFRPPRERFMAVWLNAAGEVQASPVVVGPTPDDVREKLELALLKLRAQARGPARPSAEKVVNVHVAEKMRRVRKGVRAALHAA
jgi:hypothetical protein